MPIRIAIADDHALVLHGLKRLFDGESEFEVVACCGTTAIAAVGATGFSAAAAAVASIVSWGRAAGGRGEGRGDG